MRIKKNAETSSMYVKVDSSCLHSKGKTTGEKGITLVALIITIIVLIILAAVTIITFTDLSLLETASKGTENYTNAQKYEEEIMQKLSNFADKVVRNITGIGGGNEEDSGESEEPQPPEPVQIEISDIGKYVDYKPNIGTYEKVILDTYSGNATNEAFTTQEDMKWKIWNVDEENLYLISDVGTIQQLILSNTIGYNNGVTLLDQICSRCYSANYTGIEVKNLKIEDLEYVMTIPKDANYGTQPYPEITRYAPYMWRQNESASWLDAKDNRSIAYDLTGETGSEAAMRPWWNTYTSVSLPDETYKNILNGGRHWMSSRYVHMANSREYYFGLQIIEGSRIYGMGSGIGKGNLYRGDGFSYTRAASVRPLVTIPRSSFTGTWDEVHESLSIKPI